MKRSLYLVALLSSLVVTGMARGQAPTTPPPSSDASYAPDVPEPGSVEKIAEFTTGPEYLPRSVSYVPDSPSVPSPAEVLGRISGAPDELSSVAQVHTYFRRLAEASPRVDVEVIGTSEEGREMLLAVISDEANLANLSRYVEITARLADPRNTDRAAMEQLTAEGKVIYYLMGGLHSTETGSPEMLQELAYRLAVSERPEIRAIREDAIVLITPVVEPDGRDRVVEWYYRHLKGKNLPYRDLDEFSSPPYWGHYAFHDNNRDGMQLALSLTQNVHETFYRFHPQVIHDLHESLPLLYISTGHGPYTEAADPVTINEWTQFAHHEASELQAMGLPGVWTWGFWDGWWPGYLFSVANNHNAIGRFYETFGNSMAGTFERKLKDVKFVGKPVTEAQWYRPWPPDKKVRWSLRNNTNYMEAGVLEALGYAAVHRQELLRNFWVKGERSLAKGKSEAPYAWVFPSAQRDPGRLNYLLNQLGKHRIEIHTLTEDFAVADTTYAKGSAVVRLDQPYRNAVLNFLEDQKFPADEPNAPYDDVAWTWPLMYGVEGARIDDKKILDAPMSPAAGPFVRPGAVIGDAPVYLVEDRGQTAFLAARVRLGRFSVEAAETAFVAHVFLEPGMQMRTRPTPKTFPAGSWIVRAPGAEVEKVARELGLTFVGTQEVPDVPRHKVDLPRLAVMHTWVATQDCGWVRYTLDQGKIPYTLIADDDLRKGGLRSRFDVILFPDTWGGFSTIVHGIDRKYGPLAYTKTAAYRSHGVPNATADITGGMGFEGLRNVQRFIEEGGVFIALADGGTLLVDGGIVRGVNRANAGGGTPGSVLRAKVVNRKHPIVYGYEEMTTAFRGNGPLWDVAEEDHGWVVLQFGTKEPEKDEPLPAATAAAGMMAQATPAADAKPADGKGEKKDKKPGGPLVLSGFVKSAESVDGKPAILDVPTGKGRAILFAFNPLHRYLTHAHFRYVYNTILNWNDLPKR